MSVFEKVTAPLLSFGKMHKEKQQVSELAIKYVIHE